MDSIFKVKTIKKIGDRILGYKHISFGAEKSEPQNKITITLFPFHFRISYFKYISIDFEFGIFNRYGISFGLKAMPK